VFGRRNIRRTIQVPALLLALLGMAGCPPSPGNEPILRVGTPTCLACHDGHNAPDKRTYAASAHFQAGVGCEDCHGPGHLHVQNRGRAGLFIINPAKTPFAERHQACAQCHEATVEQFERSAHFTEGAATCYQCHRMHEATDLVLPREDNRTCLVCHAPEFPDDAAIEAHTFHLNIPTENASLCTGCHMAPLQRDDQRNGSYDHSWIPVQPAVTSAAIAAGVFPPPANTCAGVAGCHDGSNEAPFFDIDSAASNDRLQRIYELRYGPSAAAALVQLVRGT